MSDHVLGDGNIGIRLSVVHLELDADEAGHNRARARLRLDGRHANAGLRALDGHGDDERSCFFFLWSVYGAAGGGGGMYPSRPSA